MIDYVSRSDYVQNSVGSVEFDDSTDGSWVRYTTYFTGQLGSLRTTTDLYRFHHQCFLRLLTDFLDWWYENGKSDAKNGWQFK